MLEKPLGFVTESVNQYLRLKGRVTNNDILAELTDVVDDEGKFAVTSGRVGVSVINIAEEKVNKAQIPEAIRNTGDIAYVNPEMRLNVHLLFTANFGIYKDSLRAISAVISFFQGNNVFRPETHPGLDSEVQKIIFDLESQSLEQLSYIWGFLGTSYKPSVVYKMRLVTIQEGLQRRVGGRVQSITTDMEGIGS